MIASEWRVPWRLMWRMASSASSTNPDGVDEVVCTRRPILGGGVHYPGGDGLRGARSRGSPPPRPRSSFRQPGGKPSAMAASTSSDFRRIATPNGRLTLALTAIFRPHGRIGVPVHVHVAGRPRRSESPARWRFCTTERISPLPPRGINTSTRPLSRINSEAASREVSATRDTQPSRQPRRPRGLRQHRGQRPVGVDRVRSARRITALPDFQAQRRRVHRHVGADS
jgi:hypothetical protein